MRVLSNRKKVSIKNIDVSIISIVYYAWYGVVIKQIRALLYKTPHEGKSLLTSRRGGGAEGAYRTLGGRAFCRTEMAGPNQHSATRYLHTTIRYTQKSKGYIT